MISYCCSMGDSSLVFVRQVANGNVVFPADAATSVCTDRDAPGAVYHPYTYVTTGTRADSNSFIAVYILPGIQTNSDVRMTVASRVAECVHTSTSTQRNAILSQRFCTLTRSKRIAAFCQCLPQSNGMVTRCLRLLAQRGSTLSASLRLMTHCRGASSTGNRLGADSQCIVTINTTNFRALANRRCTINLVVIYFCAIPHSDGALAGGKGLATNGNGGFAIVTPLSTCPGLRTKGDRILSVISCNRTVTRSKAANAARHGVGAYSDGFLARCRGIRCC